MLHHQILEQQKLVIIKADANSDFQDALDIVKLLNAEPRFKAGLNSFMDARAMSSPSGKVTDFLAAARIASKEDFSTKRVKSAIVVKEGDDVIERIMNGFVLMTSASPVEHKVFTDTQWTAALHFLGLSSLPENAIVQFDT